MESLYLLVTAIFFCIYVVKTDVCIYSDTNLCTNCEYNITTQEIAKCLHATEEINFKLCSDLVPLKSLIAFEDRITLSITGYKNGIVIQCDGDEVGLKFVNVTNITLENFKLLNCGAEHNSTSLNVSTKDTTLIFKCSVYLLNCSDITMRNVHLKDSDGTGLAIFDGNGNVLIENCTFENNRVLSGNTTTKVLPGGGGLYIEFTYCTPGLTKQICNGRVNERTQNSSYTIRQCTFRENNASTGVTGLKRFQSMGKGGGLNIYFRGYAKSNIIHISDCIFQHNSAIIGGGLYIIFRDSTALNTVNIEHTEFINNTCYLRAMGGGVYAGFISNLYSQKPTKNRILLSFCNITNNAAKYGGGVRLYSSRSSNFEGLDNSMTFQHCNVMGNTASASGAGIMAYAYVILDTLNIGLSPSPICNIESNFTSQRRISTHERDFLKGQAVFLTRGADIVFEGTTTFMDNNNTALYIGSSYAIFANNSKVLFISNKGINGGAIVLVACASMVINDNSTFHFINNTAEENGGAISVNPYTIVSKSCFIQYAGDKNLTERKIEFTFNDNQAGDLDKNNTSTSYYYGHSIYANTLLPCCTGCQDKDHVNISEILQQIAHFYMVDRAKYEISTMANTITRDGNESEKLYVIPGKVTELPIALKDELNNEVFILYHVTVKGTSAISVALEYSFTSDKKIKFYGNPGHTANVTIETMLNRRMTYSLEIKMQECPPGFYLLKDESDNGQVNKHCKCSASDSKPVYFGITNCDKKRFIATMRIGWWIGYKSKKDGYGKEEDIISGHCPEGYCYNDSSKKYTLPNITNVSSLNDKVCGTSRKGILCGRCRSGLSTYYHSWSYRCKQSNKCNIGWLFYLLTEIIPITIFFIVIIYFEVNFTVGALNGLTFYFQITESSLITNSQINHPKEIYRLFEVYKFLIGIFNLNILNMEKLSFCLWKNAQTLDLMAFEYVTILYSLFLVVLIIGSLRMFTLRRLSRKFPKLFGRNINEEKAIIHGLSGFFVLCYSECTKYSLFLLTPVRLYEKGTSSLGVYFNGELQFFGPRHLIYAIPALLFLIAFGLVPPLLLISYPLCYRIFGVLKIGESKFVRCLCTCIPLEKLKPFFDSFQSSFKDEFRFFSGLYFMYRLLILTGFVCIISYTNYYIITISQFVIMFCIHAVIQPYKERWHNILDALMFTNLILVSGLTFYNYKNSRSKVDNSYSIKVASTVQIILLYTPILYLLVTVCMKIFLRVKKIDWKMKLKRNNIRNSTIRYGELSESFLFERRSFSED